MPILAALLAAGALTLFIIGQTQRAKARDIGQAEKVKAGDLALQSREVASEIGGGSFSRRVELRGEAEAAKPLSSEIGGLSCVYYRSIVTREYEESYEEKEGDGRYKVKTRRGSEVVARNERSIPFLLRDESGSIEVDPSGAKIEAEKTLSRFDAGVSPSPTLGSFLVRLATEGLGGRRTLGYKLEEWTIPVGKRLYVLGEVSDAEGRLRVHRPTGKARRFLVSVRSAEDILRVARGVYVGLSVGAGFLAAGALALAILLLAGVLA
jgi:hypothetical protein